MFYDLKKVPLKIRGNYFQKIRQIILEKKCRSLMEKGWISATRGGGGNSEQNGKVQIFFYLN